MTRINCSIQRYYVSKGFSARDASCLASLVRNRRRERGGGGGGEEKERGVGGWRGAGGIRRREKERGGVVSLCVCVWVGGWGGVAVIYFEIALSVR